MLYVLQVKFKLTRVDFFVVLFMVLVYGFRYDVGADFISYQVSYYSTSITSDEIIYSFLENLFLNLGFDFFIFNIFLGIILFLGLYILSKLFSVNFIIVMILFVITDQLFVSFNLARNSLASMFIIFAMYFAYKGKYLIYVLFNLIAIGFHTSAIIFMPFFLIAKKRLNLFHASILLIIGAILYHIDIIHFPAIINLIPIQYQHYIGSKYDVNTNPGLGVLFYVIVALILSFIVKGNHSKIIPLSNFYILSHTIALFTLQSYITIRISRYSFFCIPIVLAYLLHNSKILKTHVSITKILTIMVVGLYIVLFILALTPIIFGDDYRNLYYQTIFSN